MKTRRLGRSAIYVSDICMGTMTFGNQVTEAEACRILDICFEAGITFYDTAENYPVPPDVRYAGRTEEIVGRWMKTKPRDAILVASKVSGPSHGWIRSAQRHGMTALDRHNIIRAAEASLLRLQTDYLDLYQTHWPDHGVAYDEQMLALDELVASGKVRVIGCSNETSWGLMKSLGTSEKRGIVRHESIQNNFSLNNRRFEDELAQVCRQEAVSLIAYSPLAGGVLTGKYQGGHWPAGARFSAYKEMPDRQASMARRFVNDRTLASTERWMELARDLSISVTTLAVAWSKQHDFVASTIVGVTSADHLPDILSAAEVTLSPDVMKKIDGISREIRYPMG